jgi:PAS domain S-box-containing protein
MKELFGGQEDMPRLQVWKSWKDVLGPPLKTTAGLVLALTVLLSILPTAALGQVISTQAAGTPIRYVADDEFPPFGFYERGQPSGFSIELIRAIAKATGRKVDIHLEPWSIALPEVRNGKKDITEGIVTSERAKWFDFSLPIAQVHYVLFVRKGSSIRSLNDAKGKSLIVENGDFIHSFLKRTHFTSKITPVPAPIDELRLLNSGGYDGAFVIKAQGIYYIRKYGLKDIEASPAGFKTVDYAFIVKKGNQSLVRDIDEGLEILKANGTFKQLYDKWFGPYEEISFYERAKYYFYALGAALALLIVVSVWLWSLRRQVEFRTSELAAEVRHRREAESELEAQRRELQDYIDRLTTLNAKLSPDGTLLKVNATAARLADKPAGELLGLKIWESPWFRNVERIRTQVEEAVKAAASGTAQNLEAQSITPSDEYIDLDISLTPVFDESGRVVSIIIEGRDITSRKLAEAASRESGEMLRLILDTIPVRVFWKDCDLVYRGANRPLADDAGLSSPEELIGKTDLDLPWIQQAESYRADDLQVINTGIPKLDYDERQQGYSGRMIWVRTSKVPLKNADGRIIGVLGTYEDITPRKLAEQAMKDSERRLASILSFLPDPTFAIDLEGRVTLWNQAMEAITGVRSEDIIGKGNYEYGLAIYGTRRPLLIDIVRGSNPNNKDLYLRFQREESGAVLAESHTPLIRPEGAYLWGKASTLYDSEGNVTGFIETMRDVTDRTITERALKESEEKFRALSEHAEALIYIIQGSRFIYTNPYFTELLGYSEAELKELDVFDIIHPEYREFTRKQVELRLSGGSVPPHYETKMLAKGGGEVWIDLAGTRIDYRGQPTLVGVGYDVTERRHTEEEKRAFYRETILSATDGKLSICDPAEVSRFIDESRLQIEISKPNELAAVRGRIADFCAEHYIVGNRRDTFMIGVGEALDNALKHAGHGSIHVGMDTDRVWVAVSDKGPGIGSLILPKAVLRRGFSTKPSMGLGYSIMLDVSDLILLNTGKEGTTVILMKNVEDKTISTLDRFPDTWDSVPVVG